MSEEAKPQAEGYHTLATRFTRNFIDRVISTIQKARRQGWAEAKILEKMGRDLQAYPAHAVRRVYAMSLGEPIPDDVAPSGLLSDREVKKDTRELVLRAPLPGIEGGGLLHYQGTCWYVPSVRGTTYLIKKLN